MFKSKLQEYCQSKAWRFPEYAVAREGPNHCPSFKAVVDVNGMSFASPDSCKSIKEAHNSAAKLAFAHFSGGSDSSEASSIAQHPESPGTFPALSADGANPVTKDDDMLKDMVHIPKAQLQIYTQKRNLPLPVYSIERVGPPHESLFKSNVTIDGKRYESEEFFRTVKEAETATAIVALASLFPTGTQEDDLCIYKNLLQVLVQKEYSCLPKYSVSQWGLAHVPMFVSEVEIQGEIFKGQEAKTKKQAEMNAAKVAYTSLVERELTRKTSNYLPRQPTQGAEESRLTIHRVNMEADDSRKSCQKKKGPATNVVEVSTSGAGDRTSMERRDFTPDPVMESHSQVASLQSNSIPNLTHLDFEHVATRDHQSIGGEHMDSTAVVKKKDREGNVICIWKLKRDTDGRLLPLEVVKPDGAAAK